MQVGQPELIAFEQAVKNAMVPAGSARETEYGKEVPLFEVDAASVEPTFQRLYTYLFGNDEGSYSAAEMNRPVPNAIFILNFDKVRMDPRNKEVDLETLTYARIEGLTPEQLKQQEGNYIYRYRYSGGGASQVWLSSGRFDLLFFLIPEESSDPLTSVAFESYQYPSSCLDLYFASSLLWLQFLPIQETELRTGTDPFAELRCESTACTELRAQQCLLRIAKLRMQHYCYSPVRLTAILVKGESKAVKGIKKTYIRSEETLVTKVKCCKEWRLPSVKDNPKSTLKTETSDFSGRLAVLTSGKQPNLAVYCPCGRTKSVL
eukprot:Gb_29085 [translate_table: standard]